MKKILQPKIVQLEQPKRIAGLSIRTGRKTICRDAGTIIKRFMKLKQETAWDGWKRPWEYLSASHQYDEGNGTWDYFTGYVVEDGGKAPPEFETMEAPAGTYAVFPVRPWLKIPLFLGLSMGRLKRRIFTQWLPNSGYDFGGIEFEYNDEEMAKKGSVYDLDLYVLVKEKGRG